MVLTRLVLGPNVQQLEVYTIGKFSVRLAHIVRACSVEQIEWFGYKSNHAP
jgi:hypothetical protein